MRNPRELDWDLVDNPPWLARAVTQNMDRLRDAVPAEWLPELEKMRAVGRGNQIKGTIEQLGCGAYGCVMPTADPKVVFKITEDTTEIEFVRAVLPKVAPPGITAYYATIDLRGKGKRAAIYGLWREAADDIGKITGDSKIMMDFAHKISDDVFRVLMAAPDPHQAYMAALHRRFRPGDKTIARQLGQGFGALVEAWKELALDEEMHHVGDALLSFLHAGVLVADVHAGNVGHVVREGVDMVVITDPGHAVVLPEPWR